MSFWSEIERDINLLILAQCKLSENSPAILLVM